MNGKGSKPRPTDGAKYRHNYDGIDWRPRIEFSITSEKVTVRKRRLKKPKWWVLSPDHECCYGVDFSSKVVKPGRGASKRVKVSK